MLIVILDISVLASASSENVSGSGPVTPGPDIRNPILDYVLDIDSESAIVIETGRGMKLYMKEPDLITHIPVASKLMTALLAVELIPEDTMITISSIAAEQNDAAELTLRAGEKYPLDYLLYGMILKDNDAAAVALAEQVSGTAEKFVEMMNEKAASYQMNDTVYTDPTGYYNESQVTTVSDVARLFRFAVSSPKLDMILKTKDSVFLLTTELTKHLISNSADIWNLVEGCTGVYTSGSEQSSSFVITARSGQINIFAIGVSNSENDPANDINRIVSSVFRDYEYSTLALTGQIFPENMTVGNETFALRFGSTINYVHPRSVDFIYKTTYEKNPDTAPPILTTKPVAKVTFILLDGTSITADLFPTVNIWSDSTFFRKIIDIYEDNKDIVHLAGVLLMTFILISSVNIIKSAISFFSSKTSR